LFLPIFTTFFENLIFGYFTYKNKKILKKPLDNFGLKWYNQKKILNEEETNK